MQLACGDIKNAGLLDFVSAWYVKAERYMDLSRSESFAAKVDNLVFFFSVTLSAGCEF